MNLSSFRFCQSVCLSVCFLFIYSCVVVLLVALFGIGLHSIAEVSLILTGNPPASAS